MRYGSWMFCFLSASISTVMTEEVSAQMDESRSFSLLDYLISIIPNSACSCDIKRDDAYMTAKIGELNPSRDLLDVLRECSNLAGTCSPGTQCPSQCKTGYKICGPFKVAIKECQTLKSCGPNGWTTTIWRNQISTWNKY